MTPGAWGVLLLHGFTDEARTWSWIASGLAKSGFRVVALQPRFQCDQDIQQVQVELSHGLSALLIQFKLSIRLISSHPKANHGVGARQVP
jgi:hypothetical protein